MINRATRYDVHAPLRYRRVGEHAWLAGATCNISTTGVLFAAETALPPGTMLELSIALPRPTRFAVGPSLVGSGLIVRGTAEAASRTPFLAAQMVDIKLVSDRLFADQES